MQLLNTYSNKLNEIKIIINLILTINIYIMKNIVQKLINLISFRYSCQGPERFPILICQVCVITIFKIVSFTAVSYAAASKLVKKFQRS